MMIRGMPRRLSSAVLSPSAKAEAAHCTIPFPRNPSSFPNPLSLIFFLSFQKRIDLSISMTFSERIYHFYIQLLERNGYNIHRQNEIDEYVTPVIGPSKRDRILFLTLYSKRSSVPIRERCLHFLFFRKEYPLCLGIQKSQNS